MYTNPLTRKIGPKLYTSQDTTSSHLRRPRECCESRVRRPPYSPYLYTPIHLLCRRVLHPCTIRDIHSPFKSLHSSQSSYRETKYHTPKHVRTPEIATPSTPLTTLHKKNKRRRIRCLPPLATTPIRDKRKWTSKRALQLLLLHIKTVEHKHHITSNDMMGLTHPLTTCNIQINCTKSSNPRTTAPPRTSEPTIITHSGNAFTKPMAHRR
jgi:hypothetical protein